MSPLRAFTVLLVSLAALQRAPSADFPGATWEKASSPEALGWSSERLAALTPKIKDAGSSAFMIVTRGQVVAEWGDTSRTFLTHSIRKSFMSALYGMAVAEGKIDVERTLGSLGVTDESLTLTPAELEARLVDC
jgi:CubicO group peptidase (beta-lactamase class C family)